MPGAEILGREVIAHALAKEGIHLAGIDAAAMALFVDILEQPLAGQVLASAHQCGEARVPDAHLVQQSTLAGEPQHRTMPPVAQVPVLQGGQAEAAIAACIFVVADACTGAVHQRHHQREDFLARQSRQLQQRA